MQTITRENLKQKIDRHDEFHLIEVLSPANYGDFHLPGAVNVPLASGSFEEKIVKEVPNKDEEIVVYCKDTQCDMAPRAARRLEELGYKKVFDYQGGKEDWKTAGLPIEH